jgi:hypothetical protein
MIGCGVYVEGCVFVCGIETPPRPSLFCHPTPLDAVHFCLRIPLSSKLPVSTCLSLQVDEGVEWPVPDVGYMLEGAVRIEALAGLTASKVAALIDAVSTAVGH